MFSHRPVDPYRDGQVLADAMAHKLGKHEGSEGHPVNFERSGDFHRYLKRYIFDAHRDEFILGYREQWRAILRLGS